MRGAREPIALAAIAAVLFASSSARATIVVDVPPERSRVEALADAIRAATDGALEGCPSGAIVVRVRAELPPEAPRANALTDALLRPTLSALRDEPDRWPLAHLATFEGEGRDAARRGQRLGYDVVLDLTLRAAGNYLAVEGAVWTRDAGTPTASFDARTRLDGELRSYLGALPRVTEETVVARVAALPSRGYLAMAAHDLDGDGTTELVLVGDRAVSVLRLGASTVGVRFDEIARAPLPADVPTAPSITRRPLATAVASAGAIVVRLSALAAPVRVALEGDHVEVARASGPCPDGAFPFDAGCAELMDGRDFFDDVLAPFDGGAPFHTPSTFYAHASRRVRAQGGVVEYQAVVSPQGRLAVRVGARSAGDMGYGTALAMTDLDEDGTAELLASSASAEGAGDQLSLLRAFPRGALHVLWRSEPIEGSIWIADNADLDGDGLEELLAIEEPAEAAGTARLWIVR